MIDIFMLTMEAWSVKVQTHIRVLVHVDLPKEIIKFKDSKGGGGGGRGGLKQKRCVGKVYLLGDGDGFTFYM